MTSKTSGFEAARKRIGRPTLMCEEIITEAVEVIRNGAHFSMLAAALGIERQTFYDWVRRGERSKRQLQRWQEGDKVTGTRKEKSLVKREREAFTEREALFIRFSDTIKLEIANKNAERLRLIEEDGRGSQKIVTKEVWERQVLDLDPETGRRTFEEVLVSKTTSRSIERDWKALAYVLEKTNPDEYGNRQTLNIKSLGFDPKDLDNMTLEELEDLAARLGGGEDIDGAIMAAIVKIRDDMNAEPDDSE